MQEPREVILITGKKVSNSIVQTVYMSFTLLVGRGYTRAIYELRKACESPHHSMSGQSGGRLYDMGLVEYFDPRTRRFSINAGIGAVVMAAVVDLGEGRFKIRPQKDIICGTSE